MGARTRANDALLDAVSALAKMAGWRFPLQERAIGQSNGNPTDAALDDLARRLHKIAGVIKSETDEHESVVGHHHPAKHWDTFETGVI